MSLIVNIKKKLNNYTLNVSFETYDQAIGVLGKSGAGKSMILKCIAGIETPDSGTIILNNKVLFDSSKKINVAMQERKIAYLFQNYALFPHLSVKENIEIVLKNNEDINTSVNDLLKQFKLIDIENEYPNNLSGGQQQRVALARILAYNPDVILLDEPFSSLDISLKNEMYHNLKYYLANFNKDIIIVSHNYEEIFTLCNQTMVIKEGINLCNPTNNSQLYHKPKYLEIARLFDCQNFSKVINKDGYIFATDWNISLDLKYNEKDNISYVGLYNQDILVNNNETKNIEICDIINYSSFKLVTFKFNNNGKTLIKRLDVNENSDIENIKLSLSNILLLKE